MPGELSCWCPRSAVSGENNCGRAKIFSRRLFGYAILTLRDDERVGEICAKAVTHAESQDVQNPPSDLLAVWRAGDCSCADFRAFTVFPDCRFRRGGANARNELGHLGCDLLSVAFCGLQYPPASGRCSGRRGRFLFWTVVGISHRIRGQCIGRSNFVCPEPLGRRTMVSAKAVAKRYIACLGTGLGT